MLRVLLVRYVVVCKYIYEYTYEYTYVYTYVRSPEELFEMIIIPQSLRIRDGTSEDRHDYFWYGYVLCRREAVIPIK